MDGWPSAKKSDWLGKDDRINLRLLPSTHQK